MQSMKQWDITETAYPATRIALENCGSGIDDYELEEILLESFPGAYPEDVENFMKGLRQFGRQVSPGVQKALPGMIQGAVQGGMVAGPWGAIAGAGIGGASSLLSKGGTATKPPKPSMAGIATPSPSTIPVTAQPTSKIMSSPQQTSPTASSLPAQQLLALLSRPETLQALSSLAMSSGGRTSVRVGNNAVPVASFANAISEFAAAVAENYPANVADTFADYLVDDAGNPRCDVINPGERAALLMSDIAEVIQMETQDEYDDIY